MKIAFRLVLFLALAAAGIWLWTVLSPSPEKVIRRQLLSLARAVSSPADESDLARLTGARAVAGFFSTNVELNLDLPEIRERNSMDREEITQAALAGRSRPGGLTVKFPDINVTVAPDRQSAVADVTVDADIRGEHDAWLQELKFTLRQVDGQWLITRIETVRVLS